ncbi:MULTISPECIES: NUDIX domain-containing protein [Pseudomonas]|uniref:NUDIX domain-containing protein n=1 Tax=Pseudomonas TaxID=286 RepID=UPI002AB8A8DC|nr:NUDIX domain-containing protein [Pseudomonas monsensis]MDZ3826908.1 ADP-ribose pyrophosphatase [Pseudomonas monsensis]
MNHRNVRIVAQHLLSDNWYLLKKIDFELQRRDGSWQALSREVYDRGNGATIALYNLAQRSVILIRQFRIPTFVNDHDGYLIETAAGLLDNASPEERIRLEAEEETGYRVRSVRKVYEAFMSPGSVTERLHFFVGEYHPEDRISDGGGLADEGEDIEVLELPFDQALAMVDDGRIMDGKTIILLQYLKTVIPPSPALMILVAGPYRSGTGDDPAAIAANLQAMQACAAELLQAGHFPLLAEWVALPLVQLAGSQHVGDEVYQAHFHDYAKTLLQRCDAVLRIGGESAGADQMVELARQRGLAVYHDLREIPAAGRR